MTFSVLFVCTGNICRSPVAERLTRAWLAQRHPDGAARVLVSSAGTGAVAGHAMTEESAALVEQHGGDPRGHVARQVTEAHVQAADLVLTMTRLHRSAVVGLRPSAVHRTFTVREAGRLATACGGSVPGGAPEDRWRALVPALVAVRGSLATRSPRADDVVDPFRRPAEVYEQCAAQLLPALTALVGAVAPLPR